VKRVNQEKREKRVGSRKGNTGKPKAIQKGRDLWKLKGRAPRGYRESRLVK